MRCRLYPVVTVICLCLSVQHVAADPLDETFSRSFYITTLGAWGMTTAQAANGSVAAYPNGVGSVNEYRSQMLNLVGGVQPTNVKIGIANQVMPLNSTQGSYYDYIYTPNIWASVAFDMQQTIAQMTRYDMPTGLMVNCTPWGDDYRQGLDTLMNYLETTSGGLYLQRDRSNRFRNTTNPQDPTIDEGQPGDYARYLELQLTLSRNATAMQNYYARNVRQASRIAAWYREMYPDLFQYISMSSEYGQNANINSDWCDYSAWSVQEFRDWLGGTGLYVGKGQYASFAAFKADPNIDTAVASFTSFSDVTPPTTPDWATTTDSGRWWRTWHSFRVAQITTMVQSQFNWSREAGWSPDRVFGHQIPYDITIPPNPGTQTTANLRNGSNWATTFGYNGSNGITTYGGNASNTTIFNAQYANDKNWGIFEFNPLSTVVSTNLTALNNVWNSNGHIICPYYWGGDEGYRIQGGSALLQALQQFMQNRQNSSFAGLPNRWELSADSRDVVWAMSESNDVEASNNLTGLSFTTGTLRATVNGADPWVSLELNDPTNLINADDFDGVSLRMNAPAAGTGEFYWQDTGGTFYSVGFPVTAGWRLYRINLAANANWTGKQIKTIRLDPLSANTGGTVQLDWVRLHACPAWPLSAAGEVNGIAGFSGATVSGGVFSGTDNSNDGYFYLTTDKSAGTDADRAMVDANQYTMLRVRMTASATGTGQFYWWRRGDATPYFVSFAVASGTQTYNVDLAGNANWTGDITQLRLDPVNTSGVSCQVDQISFVRAVLPPRPANNNMVLNTQYPVFAWEAPIEPDRSGLTYDFQLSSDFGFGTLAANQLAINGTQYIYQGAALDGAYWWRARTRDAGGGLSGWSVPMPVFLRKWEANDVRDVALKNNIGTSSTTGGVFTATSNGGDPYIYFNNAANTGETIDADTYKKVRMRLRYNTPGGQYTAQFYFFPEAGGAYAVNFPFVTNNQFNDYELDLSGNPNWTGKINQIRLDPFGQNNLTFAYDEAQVLPAAIAAPAPVSPIVNFDFNFAGNTENLTFSGDLSGINVAGGQLSANVSGMDPYIYTGAMLIDANTYRWIHVRMRNNTASTFGEIFWITNTDPNFDVVKRLTFPLVPNDTVVRDYDINVGASVAWQNTITQFRLDPANGATGFVAIDLIEVTQNLVPVELSTFEVE